MDDNPMDDNELMKRAQNGCREAFRELLERHHGFVCSLLFRQTGDKETARELAQEVFVSVYKGLASFKGNSTFKTWLYRIVLNSSANYFNSRQYRETRRNSPLAMRGAVGDFSGEGCCQMAEETAIALRESQFDELRRAVAELKPIYRDVVVLCGYDGKRYQEVADILDIPLGTVCSRLGKAYALLRDALGKTSAKSEVL